MNKNTFIKILRRRVAGAAVTPSAARNMGPEGTIRAARKFLAEKVSLDKVGRSGAGYAKLLDELTSSLVEALPKGKWGAARKFLNIFVRDAASNFYLREKFGLHRVEKFLEVPVDRHVAQFLREQEREQENEGVLPKWKSVISLSSEQNKMYQNASKKFAKKENIDPIHVDIIAWRKETNYL
ncbi:MAG: hypothetical protein WD073_07095 [Xanthobacteraceae bacterium]